LTTYQPHLKHLNLDILLKLLLPLLVATTINAKNNIDLEIEKIFNAPIDKRRVLMNQLKLHIQELNQERQVEAIESLKSHIIQEHKKLDIQKYKKIHIKEYKELDNNRKVKHHKHKIDRDVRIK